MRLLSLSVAIAALLSGCLPRVEAKKEPTPQAAALPAMEMKVTVTVLDEETGKPVPDAWVLVAAHVTTNRPSPRDDLDTVAAARSITNQGGTASINEVEGTYYTWQNMDKIWTAMEEARARRLGPLKLTGMEGGSIVVASPIYGFIHQPFAVEDDPAFGDWVGQNGRKREDYHGWLWRSAFRVNLPVVFVQSSDLKKGLALTIRMRKPRDLDDWAKTISYDHFLDATWSAMSIHNGATEEDQKRLYWLFARQSEAIAFKSKNMDHLRSFASYLRDEAIEHYVGHRARPAVHDPTLQLWLAEKALEILPSAYEEVKRHSQQVLKGAEDESEASGYHFYNPNDFKTSLKDGKTALAWGAIDNKDDPDNAWDWQDALKYYDLKDKPKAYEALGHVVHLLADMSVPERTHIIDPEQSASSFEDYFASKTIAGLNALPWVYSVNAKTPLRVHTLKGHFDDLAKLTFGPMKDGGKIIDFDRYYRAIPGDKGRVVEHPDEKTMDGMGEYLLPRAIEYAAGLMEHFYDTVQPRTAVKEGPVGANEQVVVARSSGTATDKFNKFTSGTDTDNKFTSGTDTDKKSTSGQDVSNAPNAHPQKERVSLRRIGTPQSLPKISFSTLQGREVSYLAYLSPNGKFTGIETHFKGEWDIAEFKLVDEAGATRWSRKNLPYGGFYVSNQGDVVQRIGEWGGKLQFYGRMGEPLGSYESPHMIQAQGYVWDASGAHFVVTLSSGHSAKTVALHSDGSVIFERAHPEFQGGTSHTTGKMILVFGQRDATSELLVMDNSGNILKRIPWKKEALADAVEMRGNLLLVAAFSCVLLDSNWQEIARYKPEDSQVHLTEAVVSPQGGRVLVKFRKRGSNDDAGFVVLDGKATLIGRRELRGKNLRVKFINESTAEIETETERYAMDTE